MYIHVKVKAGAKRETLFKKSEDHFEIAVQEPAEANRANRRVLALLAETLAIKANRLRIISGHHAPSKIISVESGASSSS